MRQSRDSQFDPNRDGALIDQKPLVFLQKIHDVSSKQKRPMEKYHIAQILKILKHRLYGK